MSKAALFSKKKTKPSYFGTYNPAVVSLLLSNAPAQNH